MPIDHVNMPVSDLEASRTFYTAARDNGPPGERPYGAYYYAAFALDPDGHNIEAVYHGPRR